VALGRPALSSRSQEYQPPAVPAHLDQPWPDLLRRRPDRDCHGPRPLALGDQLSVRKRPGRFLAGGPPAHETRANPASIQTCRQARPHDELACDGHTAIVNCWGRRHQGRTSPVDANHRRRGRPMEMGVSLAPLSCSGEAPVSVLLSSHGAARTTPNQAALGHGEECQAGRVRRSDAGMCAFLRRPPREPAVGLESPSRQGLSVLLGRQRNRWHGVRNCLPRREGPS